MPPLLVRSREVRKNTEDGAGLAVPASAAHRTTGALVEAHELSVHRDLHVHQHVHHGPGPAPPVPIQGNIPARRNRPFVGRKELLDTLQTVLPEPTQEAVVVLHGPPGVGKSELVFEFARRQADRYPGGRFVVDASGGVPVDLAVIGKRLLGLDFPADLTVPDQCARTLQRLAAAPALVIYDNVRSPAAIEPWLPAAGMPCHAVLTTVLDRWDAGWRALPVEPMTTKESRELVVGLAGEAADKRYGMELVAHAGGLPVQLVPASAALAQALRRDLPPATALGLAPATHGSFRGPYELLEPAAQLLLQAAALRNSQRIARGDLAHDLAEAGWGEAEFGRQLGACQDLHLLEGGEQLRMHQLFAAFLIGLLAPDGSTEALARVRQAQHRRLIASANELRSHPNRTDLAAVVLGFTVDPRSWEAGGVAVSAEDGEIVGRALLEIGQFEAALPWYQRAAAANEQGDLRGRADHDSLGRCLHGVGTCLFQQGKHAEAQSSFERAVAAAEQGDVHGRVDHANLGTSLHQVGECLSEQGKHAEALPWYQRAAAAKERGDTHGRIDHTSLGGSLYAVGSCLFQQGKHAEALPWHERTVAEAEKGDVHGRIDHTSLGKSLYAVGFCLREQGKRAESQSSFERAVAAAEQGDVHGRVDHDGLGRCLHAVGFCLSAQDKHAEALPWYQRAVAEAAQGDVHGRVDHITLTVILRSGAACLRVLRRDDEAADWEERAATLDPA